MPPTKRDLMEQRRIVGEMTGDAARLLFNLDEVHAAGLPADLQDTLKNLRYALNNAWPDDTAEAHRRAVARYADKNRDKVRAQNREAQKRRNARLTALHATHSGPRSTCPVCHAAKAVTP